MLFCEFCANVDKVNKQSCCTNYYMQARYCVKTALTYSGPHTRGVVIACEVDLRWREVTHHARRSQVAEAP